MSRTRFEIARILAARALQISMGAPPLARADELMDPFTLAVLELKKKILPMTVARD